MQREIFPNPSTPPRTTRAHRAGDAVALATVYRRHSAAVYRFACLHAPVARCWLTRHRRPFCIGKRRAPPVLMPAAVRWRRFWRRGAHHALRIRAASARFDELPDDLPSAADADADTVSDALAHLLPVNGRRLAGGAGDARRRTSRSRRVD